MSEAQENITRYHEVSERIFWAAAVVATTRGNNAHNRYYLPQFIKHKFFLENS